MAACRVELAATRERCEAQAKELEALKARPPAVSPAAVALAGLVDLKGMTAQAFRNACDDVRGELRPVECRGLGASTWSVVVLEVSNTGAEPWAPAWAEVTPAAGGVSGDRKVDPLSDSNSDPHRITVRPPASHSQPHCTAARTQSRGA